VVLISDITKLFKLSRLNNIISKDIKWQYTNVSIAENKSHLTCWKKDLSALPVGARFSINRENI